MPDHPPRQSPGQGRLRRAADAYTKAMEAEQIPAHVRRRIVNRVLYGNPNGPEIGAK